jgi:hypothetical protein
MKGTLTKKSTFDEIANWFTENMSIMPDTLDSKCIYYRDLKFTIELYIYQINSEIDRLGKTGVKGSAVAKSGKNNLFNIYVNLQNKEGWNADHPKLKYFNLN